MGAEFTEREREERVARVAELLGLDVCLHSICGDALTRGVSGGQVMNALLRWGYDDAPIHVALMN